MTPLPAGKALDAYFLEARSKLLDLAAIFDRLGRGEDVAAVAGDARLEKLRTALTILGGDEPNRAEQVQRLFSLAYDPSWERPTPR